MPKEEKKEVTLETVAKQLDELSGKVRRMSENWKLFAAKWLGKSEAEDGKLKEGRGSVGGFVLSFVIGLALLAGAATIWDLNPGGTSVCSVDDSGNLTASGTITGNAFSGDITGDVTGDVTGDLTGDDITASGAYNASIDLNLPAVTNAQVGTVTVKSAQAVANLADNNYVRYILLNMYNSATAAVNYAYIDVEADDVTTATEDGSIDFYIEVNSTATKALDIDATGGTFAGQVIATEAKVDGKYAVVGPNATTGQMIATGSTTNGGTVTFGAVFGSQTPFVVGTVQGVATNASGNPAAVWIVSRNATNCVVGTDGLVADAAATVHVIAVGTRP